MRRGPRRRLSLLRVGWHEYTTCEEYLNELTTILTESHDMSGKAIKHVMRIQAVDFFALHADVPEMLMQE